MMRISTIVATGRKLMFCQAANPFPGKLQDRLIFGIVTPLPDRRRALFP
jgi:hypothetical protein